jgi:UDP-N-acetyl-D-glucosamine dehydrogenase
VPDLRDEGLDLRSVDLDDRAVEDADIVCVVTAHSGIDYQRLAERAQLVFDFRNAVPRLDGKVHTL